MNENAKVYEYTLMFLFRMPDRARKDEAFSERFFRYWIWNGVSLLFCKVGYLAFGLCFFYAPSKYQFILGLMTPLMRELECRQIKYFSRKVSGAEGLLLHKEVLTRSASPFSL